LERILSKDEIAELLSAVKDGTLDTELESSDEDYSAPPRTVSGFSLVQNKSQSATRLANFDIVLDAFARNLSFSLSNRLQRAVSVLRESISSMEYETLIHECSNHELYGIISLDPLKKNGLFIFDASISFAQVEIMLGGVAEHAGDIPRRGMTTIEVNIIKDVIKEGCLELNKAFSPIEPLESDLMRVESNPRLVTIVPSDTEMMVASFRVKINEVSGLLRLAIPYSSLDPIREKLKSELGASTPGGQWRSHLVQEVEEMDVSVAARLAKITLTVRDILDLRVGDVLQLDCSPDQPVAVLVEGKAKFSGLAGLRDGKKAVRVLERSKKRR
jgi:flagellar motor switch protein FliM